MSDQGDEFEDRLGQQLGQFADAGLPTKGPDEVALAATQARRRGSRTVPLAIGLLAVAVVVTLQVGGLVEIGGTSASTTPVAPSPTTQEPVLKPVSLSRPTAEAAKALSLCEVTGRETQVSGMALLRHASDLPDYVLLTGREPEIQTSDPAWVVAYRGVITLTTRSQGGSIEMTDPTCVVIDEIPIWFATGSTRSGDGTTVTPEPVASTELLSLPTLSP